ncbi:hypothetical protein BKA82DRAFT_4329809 [Pisolithus tinctorius]|nr:hypothetical protein BKA82DRAFT_4329809 [Pisolithus tinctorius]
MAKDPAQHQGLDLIKEGIAFEHGPHHEWSGDSHNKLTSIGFPISGVHDQWSGKWLGLWVVPNNHLKNAITYLYLHMIAGVGGMLLQMTTDCRSETTKVFGLSIALHEQSAPHLSTEPLPPHCFLHNVWNIVIEQGWLHFHLQWGEGIYNPTDPNHEVLVQWLWPAFIQHELDQLKEHFNNHPTCFDAAKKLPSGVLPNVAIVLAANYGGECQLIPFDHTVVHHLRAKIGGESLVAFTDKDFATQVHAVFISLGVEITLHNIWQVFTRTLPLLYD